MIKTKNKFTRFGLLLAKLRDFKSYAIFFCQIISLRTVYNRSLHAFATIIMLDYRNIYRPSTLSKYMNI